MAEPVYRDSDGRPYTVRNGASVWLPEPIFQDNVGRQYTVRNGISVWITSDPGLPPGPVLHEAVTTGGGVFRQRLPSKSRRRMKRVAIACALLVATAGITFLLRNTVTDETVNARVASLLDLVPLLVVYGIGFPVAWEIAKRAGLIWGVDTRCSMRETMMWSGFAAVISGVLMGLPGEIVISIAKSVTPFILGRVLEPVSGQYTEWGQALIVGFLLPGIVPLTVALLYRVGPRLTSGERTFVVSVVAIVWAGVLGVLAALGHLTIRGF